MHGIFASLPYSGNFLSIHGNTSMADYDSMSFFCSVLLKFNIAHLIYSLMEAKENSWWTVQ
jgi:hypothetical protein